MEDFAIYAVFNKEKMGLFGNTAAVVYSENLPSESVMQRLASDLNQPATTFIAPAGNDKHYLVRWFAPDAEIGLCGHGTMAAIAHLGQATNDEIHLLAGDHELSGRILPNSKAEMKLESIPNSGKTEIPDGLEEALGVAIEAYYPTSNKDIVVLKSEDDLIQMKPDFQALRNIKVFGYAVTAAGHTVDFVSRTLVPHVQQLEDHATGSSHAALAPFWAERLSKTSLTAIQHSPRGGYFKCSVSENQTILSGSFNIIATGKLTG
ncbi:MAG: PhzF family phenazine biosynthesis protein [Cyclobacteriaceae bacterium]